MKDFELIKVLGRGAYCKVMLCKKIESEQLYAIKSISKSSIFQNETLEYIKTERKILEQVYSISYEDKQSILSVTRLLFID